MSAACSAKFDSPADEAMPLTIESSLNDEDCDEANTVTVAPASEAAIAARIPATLAPTMTTSHACKISPSNLGHLRSHHKRIHAGPAPTVR